MRYLKLILAALLLLCTLNVTASADSAAVITTAEELAAMDFNGNYVLGNDIHLTGQWQPIYFAGSLDGQGHTITGLNINCTTEPNVGLFSWLDGTVSNLNIRDARITASYPDGCNASIIGTCPDAWQFDPLSSQYHVFNCNVSGTINVYGSGIVGGSGLIGAQNSTADVTINVEGSNFMSPALWGTRNCEIKGTMNITDNGGGYGEVGAVLNSFGSQSELNINVTNANPNNTEVYVYGVYGRSDVRSNSCVVSGDISSPGHASAISNSDNCEYTGTITSDNITGLFNCTGCYLGGTMKNSGERTAAKANFLADLTTDDPEEKSSNELALEYTFSDYGVTKILDIFNNIRPGCTLDIDMDITSGAAGVSINSDFMAPEGYEKHVYEQGDIQVTTTTGYISIYRNTATTGRVYLYSDSGDITVTAGKYNTGDVTAYSAGNMHVVGASLYNSGSIHVTGPGYGTAIGVYGENALNEGFIIAECASEGDISAIGAGGTGCTNTGSVYASNSLKGSANATGVSGENCLNTGSVSSNNTCVYTSGDPNSPRAMSNACGASGSGSFNTGNVTANGSCYLVHAFGNNNGASSNGYVSASGSYIANADGDGGTADANGGHYASATGANPSACGGHGSHASGATQYYWYYESHHSACIASHAGYYLLDSDATPYEDCVAIDGKGNMYVCGRTNYDLGAMTILTSGSGGAEPDAAEQEMPEPDSPEYDGSVDITLYGTKGNDNYIISQFNYALGSFSFPAKANEAGIVDHTQMYAKVVVKNNSEESTRFNLTLMLPEGFSTLPWAIQRSTDVSCSVAAKDEEPVWVPIYPLYREDCPDSVRFSVEGDLKDGCSVRVQRVSNEGAVLCRATGGVNMNDGILVQTNLDCVRDFVNRTPYAYNSDVALLTCALSQAVYEERFIQKSMENLGFTCYKFVQSSGSHGVASVYGMKKVVSGGTVHPVILATVRGTVGLEWIGNFNVGYETAMHQDFLNAAAETINHFRDYCAALKFPKQNARAIFGAHSRAAAATNLMAAILNDGNDYVKDLQAYCYATPNSTQNPRADSNIFNIVYVDDLVAYAPQGYYKHGVTFMLGDLNNDAPASVGAYYSQYCSREYMNPRNTFFIHAAMVFGDRSNDLATTHQEFLGNVLSQAAGDSAVAQAHGAENYLAWVQGNGIAGARSYEDILSERFRSINYALTQTGIALAEAKLKQYIMYYNIWNACTFNSGAKILAAVFCPVDVTIRDSAGNIVAQIVDQQVTTTSDPFLMAVPVDGHHLFGLNAGETYTFEISGSGSGSMEIEMVGVDADINRTDYVAFTSIPVEQGNSFTLEMSPNESTDNWKVLSADGTVYLPDTISATYLPASLTTLDAEAFLDTSNLGGMLVCPDGMTSIGASALSGSGFDSVLVPASVTDIHPDAFAGSNAVIHCYEGSPIHSFAVDNGIEFELIR